MSQFFIVKFDMDGLSAGTKLTPMTEDPSMLVDSEGGAYVKVLLSNRGLLSSEDYMQGNRGGLTRVYVNVPHDWDGNVGEYFRFSSLGEAVFSRAERGPEAVKQLCIYKIEKVTGI